MATCKLVVEVASAHGLAPEYRKGSASAFVVLKFDGQRFRTAVNQNKDLNPVWNKRFCFNVSDPLHLPELALEACVYFFRKEKKKPSKACLCYVNKSVEGSRSFLGKVRIAGISFVPFPDAVVMHYPLEKRRTFSRVKGALALKVYTTDDPSIITSGPFGLIDSSNNMESILQNQSSRPRSIALQHLKEITNNFSDQRILGQGGFGVVYKGVLKNGEIMAVKKIMSSLMPGPQKQFENEVYHLMMLKHPNIVRCVGYCYETRNACLEYEGKHIFAETVERLLCLEYLPKGSLDKHLSDESSGLDWSTRYKIIKGICTGLHYLHEQTDKPIIHLDLKPSNILLDDSMEPKITDFGLSRLLDKEQTICTSSRDGTFGYMAPEFIHGGKITPKSDIFSLGVIILEIITGCREYVDVNQTSSHDFIELALKRWRNALKRAPGYRSLEIECQEIKRCLQVGLICVNFERMERPPIMKVINMLQESESIDNNIGNAATLSGSFEDTKITTLVDSDMRNGLPNLSHQEVQLPCKDFYNIVGSTTCAESHPIMKNINMLEGPESIDCNNRNEATIPRCFKSNEITILIDSDMLKSLPNLSRHELEVDCEDFRVIGSTPETVVYKGTMTDGSKVSVISLCAFEGHWTSQHELLCQNKVIDLSRLNHENIAKFLGYRRESDPFSRMLVLEYTSNGTLYEHLHCGEAAQLSWDRRMKIAVGIAKGLRYLHTKSEPPFAISKLSSNSVYVTEDFTPKLVDYECSKMMFTKHEKALDNFSNKAPFPDRIDSSEDKHGGDQCNTYAFGVILLEIISGRLPYCKDNGYLVHWAINYL